MKLLHSSVAGHVGLCTPTWLTPNQSLHKLLGGITGFFKSVKKRKWWFGYCMVGEEFHGIIKNGDLDVTSTACKESCEFIEALIGKENG